MEKHVAKAATQLSSTGLTCLSRKAGGKKDRPGQGLGPHRLEATGKL